MKKLKYIFLVLLLFSIVLPVKAKEKITIYLFYSDTCPHCREEKEFLGEFLIDKDIDLKMYEVTKNEDNNRLLTLVKESLGCTNNYVPYTVIGKTGLTGFSQTTASQIEYFVSKYSEEEYIDIVSRVIEANDVVKIEENINNEKQDSNITLPIIGKVDSKNVSLPLVATIIGFVDGFNPCAMWVLIFLISMLIGSKNKKRMFLLGTIFLLTSALIYMLFMLAWLKIMLSALQINIIKIIIGIIAIIGAIWNLKSFYNSLKKDVGCEIVNDNKRKRIINKIKKFTSEKSLLLSLIGIIGLAISVNFIEFACSAGWPVVFTEILALNDLNGISYFIYILIYIFFYLIDDLVIFIIALATLKITGISNKYNKYSHLIGGILMLIIGILMIFKPEVLMMNF